MNARLPISVPPTVCPLADAARYAAMRDIGSAVVVWLLEHSYECAEKVFQARATKNDD